MRSVSRRFGVVLGWRAASGSTPLDAVTSHPPSQCRSPFRLAFGPHSPRLLPVDKLRRQSCSAMPASLVLPITNAHPTSQNDGGGQFVPTSPSLTPRLNPHRAHGTDGAHSPAISCL